MKPKKYRRYVGLKPESYILRSKNFSNKLSMYGSYVGVVDIVTNDLFPEEIFIRRADFGDNVVFCFEI